MFNNRVYLPTVALLAAVLATMAKAEGCYNGGNTNAVACYNQFSEDFCSDATYGTRSECHVLDSGTHLNAETDFFMVILGDFSVTGPAGNPAYSDCSYAMAQLAYFCAETGGLKTWNGYQYKLDPNDGGSC
ncbi:hypothetical protein K438DRAFT_1961771 [Mycena galopus ATCC 62051]|nr:hypothetical protein K438DRAFT_1961771 [Mycena galopus ATCC 62051]